ncbi:hypothetical protein BU25DRAFT_227445 [Macroventuria anomochaeta]|uniref:Uncharacterized protein n=1 Tax=Macroventuria anomochaeta TaxID=301207 RepID=A0ACB6SB70_9PLEO|nr:uncharacterized protein BU25DRAFT_227445 [Macroventuria anomochaeta]KAF2631309.1 hypothetical protein BU25DRAFT_227445 [Macroventuria anomochaeta]
MPPKKKTEQGAEATAINVETKFSWTPENDRTLLLLSLGRNIGTADYEKFVTALPAGANFQGVRQRICKLRAEQKKKHEDMGWELTREATAKTKAPATPKKRKSSEEDGDGETPVKAKKARARKGAKSEETVQNDDEDNGGKGEGVKEENVDQAV